MAKLVIAGQANCPYYARVELLADKLALNLPDFKLHKIVIEPGEWQDWLTKTCQERGWERKNSPLVWRELIDRGGKGILIGGANEFQEYARGYYNIASDIMSDDMLKVAEENLVTNTEITEEEHYYKSLSKPLHMCITNASSPVCYHMIHAISRGDIFGPDTEIALHLYDNQGDPGVLEGLEMETRDLACSLLRKIIVTSNVHQAFADCSTIVLLDEIPQMSDRAEWIQKNAELFSQYGNTINEVAKPDVKVIVAGSGPTNFNTCVLIQNAPRINQRNFVSMSRMVENHTKAVIADRLNVNSAGVADVLVWGNINGEHYIDVSRARVHGYDGAIWGPPSYSRSVVEMVHDNKWLETEFLEVVAKRRATEQESLGHPAVMSYASNLATLLSHSYTGSPQGQIFSLGVSSEGWYGVPEGLVFSFPVTWSTDGSWSVVTDIDLPDQTKEKIAACVKDLRKEKYCFYPASHPPTPSPPPESAESQTQTSGLEGTDEKKAEPSDTGEKEGSGTEGGEEDGEEDDDEDKPPLGIITEDPVGEESAQKA